MQMKNLEEIIAIADKTNQEDLKKMLEEIYGKMNIADAPIILPLVGEFSSGKTTLINALTDCKQLETATKPTTATIYEIFFGNEKCSAGIVNQDGSYSEVSDISELKNDNLKDAHLVNVFDTSTRISKTTVLIDTPGLSSPNPKHKEVLLEFIPKADGILLVTDINQQITKSLVDFAKTIYLSNRPIYLVVTKCDTKSQQEIEDVKKYIRNNSELKFKDIVCVSAKNNDLNEFYDLLDNINKDKASILKTVNEQRVKNIVKTLSERIDELLLVSENADDLDEAIKYQEKNLKQMKNNIDKLIIDTSEKVKDIDYETCRNFKNIVFERIEKIVLSNQGDYDSLVFAEINGISSQCFSRYKNEVQQTLYEIAGARRNSELEINLQSLNDINYSELKISSMPYNLDLNTLGHENDKWISGGVKVMAAVAAAGAAVATGGAAVVGAALAGSADLAVFAGYNMYNNKSRNKELAYLRSIARRSGEILGEIDDYDNMIGRQTGQEKGFIEGIVSKITDKCGKPQRQKAINEYIDSTLIPNFSEQLRNISQSLMAKIQNTLKSEAEQIIAQKTSNLKDLNEKKSLAKTEYKARISMLMEHKKQLATII